MTNDSGNRLLLELEQARREINRKTINPEIHELALTDLEPILKMVAEARAAYVKKLFELAATGQGSPTVAQIKSLGNLRTAFEEMVAAANALETMIKRGYLDVRDNEELPND